MKLVVELAPGAEDVVGELMKWLEGRRFCSEGEIISIRSPRGKYGLNWRLMSVEVTYDDVVA